MSDKKIEMMKKLIEEKKKKGAGKCGKFIPDKSIGSASKDSRGNKKTGGMFDKG